MDIAPKHSLSLGNSEVAVAGVDSQPVIFFLMFTERRKSSK